MFTRCKNIEKKTILTKMHMFREQNIIPRLGKYPLIPNDWIAIIIWKYPYYFTNLYINDKEKLTLVPRQSINYLNYLICYIWLLLQNIVQLTKIELYLAVYIIYIFRFSRFVFYIGNSMTYSD